MKKIEWNKYAQEVIVTLGGQDNIKDIYHCATRLRFHLFDSSKLNVENLKLITVVKGYTVSENEHQLIIGAGTVDKLFKAISNILGNNTEDFKTKNNSKLWNKNLNFKQNSFALTKRGLNAFAAIFVPLVPVFIAGGMCLAFQSLVNQISPNTGFAKILEIIGGGILGSLPAFVGFTAAKKWGGNPYLGMAMGLILIAPALLNSWATSSPVLIGVDINASDQQITDAINSAFENWKKEQLESGWTQQQIDGANINQVVGVYQTLFSGFWKIKLIGYQAQVIPVLLVLALSVNLERLLRKFVPDVLAVIVVPLAVVIITTWLAFWIIGPIGQIIGRGIAIGLTAIFKYTNYYGIGFGGMIFAGMYPLLVVTGLHQGFLPIETQLLMDSQLQYGHSFSFITPVACVSNIAQGAAILVAVVYIRNKSERSKAVSGCFGANLGITEPAMFGVNLQIKPLFVGAIIGSATGGYWLGMTHTVANSLGSASWIGLVQFDWTTKFVDQYYQANNIPATLSSIPPGVNAVIAMVIAAIAAFTSAFLLMKTKWGVNSLKSYIENLKIDIKPAKKKNKSFKKA